MTANTMGTHCELEIILFLLTQSARVETLQYCIANFNYWPGLSVRVSVRAKLQKNFAQKVDVT